MDRRTFLGNTGKGLLAASAATAGRRARADKANDKIVLGVIGLGGRGRGHANYFAYRDDVEVAYVCDVDTRERLGSTPERIGRIQKNTPKGVADMREIFDDKDVDAVVVATTDHWHALATIWACQAGKDVYVEKPPSHNVWEGRKMIEAARKYERVVQTGTQNRSAQYVRDALDYIERGRLGKVSLVKVFGLEPGGPFTCPEDSPAPEGLDYDRYLGPAPMRPFNGAHFHGGWKMFWDYSGGDMADDGVHQLDIARLLIGNKPYPKAVNASGGVFAFNDCREVPDTQSVTFEYDDLLLTFELSQWANYMRKTPTEVRNGDDLPDWATNATRIEVYGSKEMMYVGRHGGGWRAIRGGGKVSKEAPGREASNEHRENFIDCIRSRKRPNGDIEVGHASAVLVHLANIATRLGGRRILFDGENESIPNDPEANALLKRDYRTPYVIPEEV